MLPQARTLQYAWQQTAKHHFLGGCINHTSHATHQKSPFHGWIHTTHQNSHNFLGGYIPHIKTFTIFWVDTYHTSKQSPFSGWMHQTTQVIPHIKIVTTFWVNTYHTSKQSPFSGWIHTTHQNSHNFLGGYIPHSKTVTIFWVDASTTPVIPHIKTVTISWVDTYHTSKQSPFSGWIHTTHQNSHHFLGGCIKPHQSYHTSK